MMIPGQFLTKDLVQRLSVEGLRSYERPYLPFIAGSNTAADRRTIVIPPMRIDIGGRGYKINVETALDLNETDTWDSIATDYRVPVTRAGKSFLVYACRPAKCRVPIFKVSANSSAPVGYTTSNSRKVIGFDCLPYVTAPTFAASTTLSLNYVVQPTSPDSTYRYLYKVTTAGTTDSSEPTWPTTPGQTVVSGTVTFTCVANSCQNLPSGHPYKDFEMGSIIFNSIWDLYDRPRSTFREGMAKISLTPWDGLPALWCDIYLASGDGSVCTSVFGATIQDTKTWYQFNEYAALQQKRLLSFDEFTVVAEGSNQRTNIAGSADPGTVTFPLDTTGRSMISKYGIIGCCGAMWQWISDHIYRLPDSGDLASCQTWGWVNQGDEKGSAYLQNSGLAESALLAGGAWDYGSFCGSRSRGADDRRADAYSAIGCRFVAEPM